jgi:hypothetical protein
VIALLLQVRTAFINRNGIAKIAARHLKTVISTQNSGKNPLKRPSSGGIAIDFGITSCP